MNKSPENDDQFQNCKMVDLKASWKFEIVHAAVCIHDQGLGDCSCSCLYPWLVPSRLFMHLSVSVTSTLWSSELNANSMKRLKCVTPSLKLPLFWWNCCSTQWYVSTYLIRRFCVQKEAYLKDSSWINSDADMSHALYFLQEWRKLMLYSCSNHLRYFRSGSPRFTNIA